MSWNGRDRLSEADASESRVVQFERILLSIVLGGLISFGAWMLIGIGLLVSQATPLWIPFALWPFVAIVLWIVDKGTE